MRDTWKAARVGLMVLVGIIATVAIYRYIDERHTGPGGYHVYALFEDAQGLIPQSRVVIAGIPVGQIERISLQGELARVDIRMDGEVALFTDARIAMRQASLLGEKLLVINPGTVGHPRIPDRGRILVVEETVEMQDVMATVRDIAESVRAVTTQLERSFGTDTAGQQMQSVLRNLSEALERINATIQANADLISSTIRNIEGTTAAAGPRLVRILDNVESASGRINALLRNNDQDLNRGVGEIDDTIASIHRASEELEVVLADVSQVTGRAARGEGTIGRMSRDEVLIDEVEGIAEGLNDVVGGIGRLRTIVELRGEYNIRSNTFKTYFGVRLVPREGRYILAQIVDDPRGNEEYTRTTVYQNPPPIPGGPPVYTETRIRRTQDLLFTIMMAKRVSFATFRFGIIESSGGLGLDFNFFGDRLEIDNDVFDVGREAFPRLRTRVCFEIVSRFWLIAGIDNALNTNRDFFLGLQLRFDDEDLKSLLPFSGSLRP